MRSFSIIILATCLQIQFAESAQADSVALSRECSDRILRYQAAIENSAAKTFYYASVSQVEGDNAAIDWNAQNRASLIISGVESLKSSLSVDLSLEADKVQILSEVCALKTLNEDTLDSVISK